MNNSSPILSAEHHAPVPLWRDVRVLRWLFQLVILALVVALVLGLNRNLQASLRTLGINLTFEFFTRPAGFGIGEGPAFTRTETMLRAYEIGIANTLRAVGVGIVLSSVLGLFVGIARLSRNWLVSRIALVYIELMQNIPLLVQLFFWFTLLLALPRQRHDEILSIPRAPVRIGPLEIPPLMYLSQRAAALPGIERLDSFRQWWPFLVAGVALAFAAGRARIYLKERQRRPPTGQFWWATVAFFAIVIVGWLVVPGPPLRVVIPRLVGDTIANYEGGWILTNSFQALLLGLVLYTAAFIAEAVRAGIQSVPHGQIEAATAVGLRRGQRLRLIILPQAMRVTIPTLINQYLNLTKNSSLAIAVGYPDLFNISQTIGNQTGHNIEVIAMVMVTYLAMSLLISLVLNVVNRRLQIVER